MAQTWENFEFILVDDGSPDNCWDIMQDYARRDSRIRLIRQKNAGLSAARNTGIDAARGEWIGFVDSDDYAAPEMYETLYHAAVENDAQMAVCSLTYVTPDGTLLPQHSPIKKSEVVTRKEAVCRLGGERYWYYVMVSNKLYRRELFDNVRFPVGRLHEDEYTAHLLYWQCERVAVRKEGFYYYVQRDGSIMHSSNESVKQRVDGVVGILSRAEFAQEHQLYELAFSSCNGALGRVVSVKANTPEEKQLLESAVKRADRLIDKLLKTPGNRANKGKIWLFRLSPRLYRLALKMRVKK